MADKIKNASLQPIYNRLNSTDGYHPMEAETFADWSMEAGDVITVSRDNKSYQTPVHSSTVSWKKGQQVSISSTGNETRESIAKMSSRKYSSGSSGLRSNSAIHWLVEDEYKRMAAGLDLTASWARMYVEDRYRQMRSGLYLTSSSAHMYVDSKYNQMTTGLKLTSSSAHLYVDNKYEQMSTGLKLTSSSAHMYVDSKYNQMTTGLKLTSSSAHLYVDSKYNQMKSGLDLTSSSAHLYVDSKYNQMSSGLKLTSSSARMYASSAENAAEIVARINQSTGESEIQLNANKVYIGNQRSTTVIDGKLNTSDLTATLIKSKIADIDVVGMVAANVTGTMSAGTLNGNTIRFRSSAGSGYAYTDLKDLFITSLSISQSGNTYTLTANNANAQAVSTVTFNRAITPTLSGSWSNGILTVTSEPSPTENYIRTLVAKGVDETGKIPIHVQYMSGASVYEEDTGWGVTPLQLGMYDADSNRVSSRTITSAIQLWAGYTVGGNWMFSDPITITPGDSHTRISSQAFTCSVTSEAGGTRYKYTLTASISSSVSVPLVNGQTYILYK